MATSNQVSTNRIFDTHVVDLTEMDMILPRAESENAHHRQNPFKDTLIE
jgi:hypothetical protein